MGKNKKKIAMMKDELGGEIMKEFIGLRPKCYSYLTDDGKMIKKQKEQRNVWKKKEIMFNNYVECLKEKKKILKSTKDLRVMHIMLIQNKLIK